tara:strand:- start:801 stop:1220 length:420 start_codon:yes stop_codon:yes gene_type:complete
MSELKYTSNDVLRARSKQNTITVSGSVYSNGAGEEYNVATDALVVSLPKIEAENLGAEFTFRNTGADGNNIVTLSPNAADAFHGTIANAAADSVAGGVVNKDFINTKATANKGDFITIKAVALTEWYISGGIGIWASEA